MKETSISHKIFYGTLWSAIDAFVKQGISFVTGIVLARLLFPSDYGLVGMLAIFIAISQSFIDCGFSNALICKYDRTDEDCSTAFWFNFVVGVVVYAMLFVAAPFISIFYNEPVLTLLMRIIGLNVLFNSLCIVQNALLTATLKIKIQTKISIICQIPTGLLAIFLAHKGWGVWALALQSVSSSFFGAVLLWVIAKWRPKLIFSKMSFHYLWKFGSKLLFVGFISNTYSNIHAFVIGKFYTKIELGLFSKANSLAKLVPNLLYSIVNKVSLPSLSVMSNEPEKLKVFFRMYMRVSAAIIFPIIGGLIVLAKPTILILWTSRWLGCVPLFQIICLGCVWNTLNLLTISTMQILQRPKVILKYEIINKVVGIIIITVTIPFGFIPVIYGRAFYNFYEYIVNTNCTRKYLKYKFSDQFNDVFIYIVITAISMFCVHYVNSFFDNEYIQLIVGILNGMICYIGLSFMINVKAISDIKVLRQKLKR